jgi:toxin ParE1/3/4
VSGFRLTPAARADLDSIWDYTARLWGAAQAEHYILAIRKGCEALARNPLRGRPADDIRTGYRKLPVEEHLLFYRLSATGEVEIIRILHRAMDAGSQLGQE